MSLIAGEDTYTTVAEADEYVSKNYASTEAKRTAWVALSTADKEVYLRKSLQAIENLRLIGRKYDNLQKLQFPRIINEHYLFVDQYNQVDLTVVPEDIKYGQIEEALELLSPTQDTKDANVIGGIVKSYTIGHLSETYKNVDDTGSIKILVKSKKAQLYLSKYVEGTFKVE